MKNKTRNMESHKAHCSSPCCETDKKHTDQNQIFRKEAAPKNMASSKKNLQFAENRAKSSIKNDCKQKAELASIKNELTSVESEFKQKAELASVENDCKHKCELTKKQELLNFVKFTLFSISAGIIQIGTYSLMFEVFRWTNWLCYLISLILSVLWNFTINRKFTFKSANNMPVAMLKVFAYYCVFAPLSTWWSNALISAPIAWNNYFVQIATMIINMVTEFLWCRYFVYRNSMNTSKSNTDIVTPTAADSTMDNATTVAPATADISIDNTNIVTLAVDISIDNANN